MRRALALCGDSMDLSELDDQRGSGRPSARRYQRGGLRRCAARAGRAGRDAECLHPPRPGGGACRGRAADARRGARRSARRAARRAARAEGQSRHRRHADHRRHARAARAPPEAQRRGRAEAARRRRDRLRQDQPARARLRHHQQQRRVRPGAQSVRPDAASRAARAAASASRSARAWRPAASARTPAARSACPAALCGIVGFRPTTGRWSQPGIVPISHTRDTAGPMARSVADCALLDGVVTGSARRPAVTSRACASACRAVISGRRSTPRRRGCSRRRWRG